MKSILVIDDDYDLNQTIKMLLEFEGHYVESAYNGYEALKLISKGHHYDFVFLDIMMPQIDGIAFLNKLTEMKEDFESYSKLNKSIFEAQFLVFSASNKIDLQKYDCFNLKQLNKPIPLDELLIHIKSR